MKQPRDAVDAPLFDVVVYVTQPAALRDLLMRNDLDFGCRPHVESGDHRAVRIRATATEPVIAKLAEAGYRLEKTGDQRKRGAGAHTRVRQDDRFEGGRVLPSGTATFDDRPEAVTRAPSSDSR